MKEMYSTPETEKVKVFPKDAVLNFDSPTTNAVMVNVILGSGGEDKGTDADLGAEW